MQKRLLQNLKLFLVLDSSQSESGDSGVQQRAKSHSWRRDFCSNDRGKDEQRQKPGGGSGGTQDILDMRAQLAQKQASHAPPPWYQATSKQAVAGSPAFSLLFLCLSQSAQYKPCLPAPTQPHYDTGESAERTAESTKAHAKVCGLWTNELLHHESAACMWGRRRRTPRTNPVEAARRQGLSKTHACFAVQSALQT